MALANEKRLREDDRTQAHRTIRAAKLKLTRETGEFFEPRSAVSHARMTSST